jgi:hypothetical protein
MKELHEILTIFLKYLQNHHDDDDDFRYDFGVCAAHDVIYLRGPKPTDLSEEDAKRLDELNCEFSNEEESWVFFA